MEGREGIQEEINGFRAVLPRLITGEVNSAVSPLFQRLDNDLRTELGLALAQEGTRRGKIPVLLTSVVHSDMVAALGALFPGMQMVRTPVSKPFGAEIEVLRDMLVRQITTDLLVDGEVIHVGGFADQHYPYNNKVHLETPDITVGVMSAKMRRTENVYRLFSNRAHVVKELGPGSMQISTLCEAFDARGAGAYCPDTECCSHTAQHMLFDVNMIPLSQEQVALAMLQHNTSLATVMVLIEEQSLEGGAGYIPCTDVRAVYDTATGCVCYDTPVGSTEFPPINRLVLREWLQRATHYVAGHTFSFEIVGEYGPFRKIQVTAVKGRHDLEVWHRVWMLDAKDKYAVTVPVLRKLGLDPKAADSYVQRTVVVRKKLFDSAFAHATAVDRKYLTYSMVRSKLQSLHNRVVVKGSAVEVAIPLDAEVLDCVAMGVYVQAFSARFEASQVFTQGLRRVKDLAKLSSMGSPELFVRMVTNAMWRPGANAVTEVLYRIRSWAHGLSDGGQVDPKVLVRQAPLFMEYHDVVKAGGDLEIDLAAHRPASSRGPGAFLAGYSEMLYSESTIDDPLMDGYNHVLEQVFEDYEMADELDEMDAHPRAELGRKMVSLMEAGPDRRPDTKYGEIVVKVPVVPQVERFVAVDVGDPQMEAADAYREVFPVNARMDLSADYASMETADMEYNFQVPYLQMPLEAVTTKARQLYMSKLIGPNKPKGQLSTRNMLAGIMKRNADPEMIKTAVEEGLPRRMWAHFKRHWCVDNVEEVLQKLRTSPMTVSFPRFMEWAAKADSSKLDQLGQALDELEVHLETLPLNEFVAMFKGDVKPTVSSSSYAAFSKFQTLVYYGDKRINAFWSPLMQDWSDRFVAILKPEHHVALRRDVTARTKHLTAHWPYNQRDYIAVQVDATQYDKSQESRTLAVQAVVQEELGMNPDAIYDWNEGHKVTIVRCMQLGMKMVLAYQRKSGDATTAVGNVVWNMLNVAWIFGAPVVSTSQGDDNFAIYRDRTWDSDKVAAQYAQTANLSVKLIEQDTLVSRIAYGMSTFFIEDADKQCVFNFPDPVRAYEALSRPLTRDTAAFEDMWQSFQERVGMWRQPVPVAEMERIVRSWYGAPGLDVSRLVNSLCAMGATKTAFREIWEAETVEEKI